MNDFNDCRFYHDGSNTTVFETPSPYSNNMKCQNNITCADSNETVHYQIDFFTIESFYDFFVISRNRTIMVTVIYTIIWYIGIFVVRFIDPKTTPIHEGANGVPVLIVRL